MLFMAFVTVGVVAFLYVSIFSTLLGEESTLLGPPPKNLRKTHENYDMVGGTHQKHIPKTSASAHEQV